MRATFGRIWTGPFAYSIYLCSGVLTWGLFTETLDKGQSVSRNNANLIKKLSFPKICLPIIVTLSAILNFAISLACSAHLFANYRHCFCIC